MKYKVQVFSGKRVSRTPGRFCRTERVRTLNKFVVAGVNTSEVPRVIGSYGSVVLTSTESPGSRAETEPGKGSRVPPIAPGERLPPYPGSSLRVSLLTP